jgi:hypothetical protein
VPLGDSTAQPIQFGINIEASVMAVAVAWSVRARGNAGKANGPTSYERDQRARVDCNSGHIGVQLCPSSADMFQVKGGCSGRQGEVEEVCRVSSVEEMAG